MNNADAHSALWYAQVDKMTMDYILITGRRPDEEMDEWIKKAADLAMHRVTEWRVNDAGQPDLYVDGRLFGDK